MRAALVALLVSGLAFAEDDAPKRVVDVLKGGQVYTVDDKVLEVQFGSCHLDAKTCVSVGKEVASLRAENESLKESAGVPVPWVLGGLALFFAGGFVAAKALR